MLRGDAHKLYEQLRRQHPEPQGAIPNLRLVRDIADYYAKVGPQERRLLLAWAKKEEAGLGLIPAALSGIPLIGLIFAPFIQQTVRHVAPSAWILLWAFGAVAFVAGIYIHHRQKAYSTLHVQLLEVLCKPEPPG